jgi:ketosteroid isomerase-like protein
VIEAAHAGPVLGATPDARWEIEYAHLKSGQQLVVITDGITEASGPGGRFGEERLHAELAGSGSPSLTVQGLEEALQGFAHGDLDDDAAILTIAPTPIGSGEGKGGHEALVECLFDAFNRRDTSGIVGICHDEMRFFPVTAAKMGRLEPYIGPDGLREYLGDIAGVWEELLITPARIKSDGERMLVRGRVYLRNRELGIRDMPAAWVWETRDDLLVRGEVFADPQEAGQRFAELTATQTPDPHVSPGKFQAVEHG